MSRKLDLELLKAKQKSVELKKKRKRLLKELTLNEILIRKIEAKIKKE